MTSIPIGGLEKHTEKIEIITEGIKTKVYKKKPNPNKRKGK